MDECNIKMAKTYPFVKWSGFQMVAWNQVWKCTKRHKPNSCLWYSNGSTICILPDQTQQILNFRLVHFLGPQYSDGYCIMKLTFIFTFYGQLWKKGNFKFVASFACLIWIANIRHILVKGWTMFKLNFDWIWGKYNWSNCSWSNCDWSKCNWSNCKW